MNILCRLFGFRTGGLVKKPSRRKKDHVLVLVEPSICHMSEAQAEMLRAKSGEKITYRPGSPAAMAVQDRLDKSDSIRRIINYFDGINDQMEINVKAIELFGAKYAQLIVALVLESRN